MKGDALIVGMGVALSGVVILWITAAMLLLATDIPSLGYIIKTMLGFWLLLSPLGIILYGAYKEGK